MCKFEREFGFPYVGGKHAGKEDVTISIVILKAPEFSFSGQQPELAKLFPLAKALLGVNGLQFKIPSGLKPAHTGLKNMKQQQVPKEVVEHIRVILTGRETLDVKHPWRILLNKEKDSLRLESIAKRSSWISSKIATSRPTLVSATAALLSKSSLARSTRELLRPKISISVHKSSAKVTCLRHQRSSRRMKRP